MNNRFLKRTAGFLAALALASCFGDGTGPREVRPGRFSVIPQLDPELARLVVFDKVHLVLLRPADNTVVLDTIVLFPPNIDTLDLSLTVSIEGVSEVFSLTLDMLDASNTVVFHAGPIDVTASTAPGGGPPAVPPLTYVGVGANAAGVRFVTAPATAFFQDTVLFVAEAFDGGGVAIPGTPIKFTSSDSTRAKVVRDGGGKVAAGQLRGTAQITAALFTTGSVSSPLAVQPTANGIVAQAGDNQSGSAGIPLSTPVTAQVRAADGLGVQGIAVAFAVTSGGGVLSADTVVTDATGNASTTWTPGGVLGAQALSATAVGVSGATTSFAATAGPGTPLVLAFTAQPGNAGAGIPIAPAVVVMARDTFNNPTPAFTGSVAIAIGNNPGSATLSGTTSVAAVSGVATFSNLVLSAVSTGYTLIATATGLAAATSSPFSVQPNPPDHLAFSVQPANATAGAAIAPAVRVELRDVAGNVVTGATNTLTLAIGANPSSGTLGGTVSVAAVAGVATFSNLTVDKSGTGYTLAASTGGLPTIASATFDITAAAPAQLAIASQPSDVVAGVSVAPAVQVEVRDAFGNLVTTATDVVTLALGANPTGDVLLGTTSIAAAAGMATFGNLSLQQAASGYTITATAPGLAPVASTAFAVTPAAATQLAFTTPPPSAVPQSSQFIVAASALDAFGNVATGFGGNVSVSINANPGGSTLGGTTTVAAASGVATFGNLTLDQQGFGYTLDAVAGGLATATSTPFDVGFAASVNQWVNPAGGNWSVPGNWSKGAVPVATDTVAILLAGTYTVDLDVAPLFASLFVGGGSGAQTLSGTNHTLSSPGSVNVGAQGVLLLQSGIVGSALVNQGLVRLRGTTNLNGPVTTAAGSILRIEGDGTCCSANVIVANGFTNNGTIELTSVLAGTSAQLTLTAGTLVNGAGGTIASLVGAGGVRALSGTLDNQGLVIVAFPLTMGGISPAHLNSGTIDVSGGDLTVNASAGSLTNTGTITIAAARSLIMNGGTLNQNAGTVGGAGTLALNSVAANFITAFDNTTTALAPVNSSLNGPGGLTIAAGRPLLLFTTTIAATMAVTNNGVLTVRGTNAINGAFTTAAGSTLRVEGDGTCCSASLTLANGFINNGTIDLTTVNAATSAALTVNGGALVNAAAGTINSLAGAGGTRTILAALDNAGLLTVAHPLQLSTTNGTSNNTGTIDVSGGDLTVVLSGVPAVIQNSGTITIAAARNLVISGGTLNQNAGTIGGPGTLSLNGLTANFATPFSNATTTLAPANVSLNGPGSLTNATGRSLLLVNTTVGASMAVINDGVLTIRGSNAINGTFTNAGGATLRLEGDGTCCASGLTMASGFTNNGTIDLITVSAATSATLTVNGGTLVNAPGGAINSLAGAGGTRTIAAALDNAGLLTVAQPLVLSTVNGTSNNTGTIDVTGGDLTVALSGTPAVIQNSGTITIAAARSLVISGGTLNQNAGTLGGAGTLSLNGLTANFTTAFTNATTTLLTSSTTLNGPGSLTNAAGRTLLLFNTTVGASMAVINAGVLTIRGSDAINGAFSNASGATLRLEGDGTCCASGLTMANGFTNNGSIDLTTVNAATSAALTVNGGALVNAVGGTISSLAGAGGTRTITAALDNAGLLTVAHPLQLTTTNGTSSNTGTVDISGGSLTVALAGVPAILQNSGTITIGTSQSLVISGGTLNQNAGTLGGPGTLSLNSMTANFVTPLTNAITTLVPASATLNGPGGLTNAAGRTLVLLNTTIGSNMAVTNDGLLTARGSNTINGALSTSSGSTLRLEGDGTCCASSLNVAGGFTNNGTIDLTTVNAATSTALTVSGTLVNAGGGTINSLPGAGGTRTLAAQLDNQSLLSVQHDLTLTSAGALHLNSGTISVLGSATFALTQSGGVPSFTHTGTLTVATGATWAVSGGTLNVPSGTIAGTGALALSSTTMTLGTAFTAPLALTATSSTVNGTGQVAIPAGPTLTVFNSTFAAPVLNSGLMLVRGTSAITGALTTSPGSTIRIVADPTCCSANLSVASAFTNNGTIELTSINGAQPAQLDIGGGTGTFVNSSSGVVASLAGTGGSRTIAGRVDNQGVLTVDAPLVTALDNTGTVNVSAGASLQLVNGGTLSNVVNAAGVFELANGDYGLGANLQVNGNLDLSGNAAFDNFNDHTATVTGALNLAGGARIDMTDPLDSLIVGGNVAWNTTNPVGTLIDGAIVVAGNFTQGGAAGSFRAGGNHRTAFNGPGAQSITFASPGIGANSHFNALELAAGTSVTIASPVFAAGALIALAPSSRTLSGSGNTLTVSGLDVDGLVVNNAVISSDGGNLVRFDNVTFQNNAPSLTTLVIAHPGAPSAFVFTNASWLVAPSAGAFYISAIDLNTGDGTPLAIDLTASNPVDGSANTDLQFGAQVNWSAATLRTWTGAADTDWFNPANWSNGVPAANENALVPAGVPNFPALLGTDVNVRDLTLAPGASMNLGNRLVFASGNVAAGNTITGTAGSAVIMSGSGRTVSGTLPELHVQGTVSLSGRVVTQGVDVNAGQLTLGGQTIATGILTVVNGGTIVMQNPADSLITSSDALFQGGDETNLLTEGVLVVAGNITQNDAGQPLSFVAGPNHRTVLNGAAAQTVTFQSPGLSWFASLDVDNPAGVTFASNVFAQGLVSVLPASGAVSGPGVVSTVSGLVDPVGGKWQVENTLFIGGGPQIPVSLTTNAIAQGPMVLPSGFNLTGTFTAMAPVTAAGNATISGQLVVQGGDFNPSGNTITLGADLLTTVGGTLTMQNPGSVITVPGDAIFGGGSTAGLLTDGVLSVSGNFSQAAGDARAFAATAPHRTILSGSTPRNVAFNNPSATTGSSFGRLEINRIVPAAFLGSNGIIPVLGDLTISAGGMAGADTVAASGNVTHTNGVGVSLGGLGVGGVLSAGSGFSPSVTLFTGAGQTIPSGVAYQSISVRGTAAFGASFTLPGDLLIESGALDVNGQTVIVNGNLSLPQAGAGSGVLVMDAAADQLTVLGNTTFASAVPSVLSDGVLEFQANFTAGGASTESFAATSNHLSRYTGAGTHSVVMATPGAGAGTSHFRRLDVLGPGALTMGPFVVATGRTTFGATAQVNGGVFFAVDSIITVPGAQLTLDQLRIGVGLDAAAGSAIAPDTIVFTSNTPVMPTGPTWNTIEVEVLATDSVVQSGNLSLAGSLRITSGRFVANGLFSLDIADSLITVNQGVLSMPAANPAVITVQQAVQFSGASTVGQLVGGMLITNGRFTQGGIGGSSPTSFAPSPGFTFQLSGTPGQSIEFFNPGPSYFSQLFVNDGGNPVQVLSDFHVRDSLSTAGTPMTATGHAITLHNASIDFTDVLTVDTLYLRGATGTVNAPAIVGTVVVDSGTVTPTSTFGTAAGFDLIVTGTGQLVGNTPSASVLTAGNLVVTGGGVFSMGYISGAIIGGNATFASSVPNPQTQGSLTIGGSFSQSGHPESFDAQPGHTTLFTGSGTIAFTSPGVGAGTSHFSNLQLSSSTATLNLASDAFASGLTLTDGSLGGSFKLTVAGSIFMQAPAALSVGELDADGGSINNAGATFAPVLTTLRFNNLGMQVPNLPFNSLRLEGPNPVGLANPLNVAGNLFVNDSLTLGGNNVTVGGNLSVTGTAAIEFQNGEIMDVTGDATFNGANSLASHQIGTLTVRGNFTQVGTGGSFVGAIGMVLDMAGTGPQTLHFDDPGVGTNQGHAGVLRISNATGVQLNSDAAALRLEVPTGTRTITSTNRRILLQRDLDVDGLTLNNTRVDVQSIGLPITRFDNVTFLGMSNGVIQLAIQMAGGSSHTFNNIVFDQTPPATTYISANGTGGSLAITLISPTPTGVICGGSGLCIQTGTAAITWP